MVFELKYPKRDDSVITRPLVTLAIISQGWNMVEYHKDSVGEDCIHFNYIPYENGLVLGYVYLHRGLVVATLTVNGNKCRCLQCYETKGTPERFTEACISYGKEVLNNIEA